ncbi:MAG: XRE family transcriptional regulator [Methylococcaceae bacterium]|jgi:Zn-dependent peptidase ImmA (M78 family)
MKREPVEGIQPEIFRWARQTIGLSIDDVARKLNRPSEEIEAWESGQGAPSYTQLEKLAYQVYKRPLAVFFLPKPPDEITPDREFRTLPEFDLESLSPDTYIQIRRAHAYQIALDELFNGRNPVEKPIWESISLSPNKPINKQAINIREFLGIRMDLQMSWSSDDVALKQWRQAIEESGVFVFKNSFKQKDISGFCLRDKNLPIIYVNNGTTKTRQIFSLLHELAHLLMNINGLSKFDTRYIEKLPSSEKKIEQFCNTIAAETLIPSDDFVLQTSQLPHNVESVSDERFSEIANRYSVSREAILRRFLDQGRASDHFCKQKAKFWENQKKTGSGGDWYASQNVYLSHRFSTEVFSQYYRSQISMEQASDLLGIKAKNFAGLEHKVLQGAAIA